MEKSNGKHTKKLLIAVLILSAILLAMILGILLVPDDNTNTDPTTPNATQETQKELRLPDLLGTAKAIKGNLMSALQDIKQSNWISARSKLDTVRKDIAAVRTWIEKIPLLFRLVPQAESIYELLNTADMAIPEILLPAIDLLETRPLSQLSVGDGFDTKLMCEYITFAESIMPKLENLMEAANSVDFSIVDSEGKITEALETANKLLDGYHKNPEILSMLKAMFGAQEDRLYLIAVQNSSEIRASGGFPGSVGVFRIEEGILTLGDFKTANNALANWKPKDIKITQEEITLFNYLSGMETPRDADLCPDFERVGHIWASAYEARHKESVDGVISMTPHIVQRLLAAMDKEIELFDGLVLTGDNATEVLIHDIYFKYFNRNQYHSDKYDISDQLFADAAKKTMKMLTDNISASQLLACLPILKESIEDRTLMLWMREEKEQAFVVNSGWSGGLNQDPQNPEAGIYINCVTPSKMGWFLLMDTEIGEPTKNADGSYTYPITVTITNSISEEEIKTADSYITGGLGGGAFRIVAYFFAPAGGSVDHFTATNGQNIKIKGYNGMVLGFTDQFPIRPNKPITVTYTVTTAPGVETPLAISKTPTAQQS